MRLFALFAPVIVAAGCVAPNTFDLFDPEPQAVNVAPPSAPPAMVAPPAGQVVIEAPVVVELDAGTDAAPEDAQAPILDAGSLQDAGAPDAATEAGPPPCQPLKTCPYALCAQVDDGCGGILSCAGEGVACGATCKAVWNGCGKSTAPGLVILQSTGIDGATMCNGHILSPADETFYGPNPNKLCTELGLPTSILVWCDDPTTNIPGQCVLVASLDPGPPFPPGLSCCVAPNVPSF